jgi:hypothetical protein
MNDRREPRNRDFNEGMGRPNSWYDCTGLGVIAGAAIDMGEEAGGGSELSLNCGIHTRASD